MPEQSSALIDPEGSPVKVPLMCNAGGELKGLRLTHELTDKSVVVIMGGFWRLERCSVFGYSCSATGLMLTDFAAAEVRECSFGGGSASAIVLMRRSSLIAHALVIQGVQHGLDCVEEASCFVTNSTIRNNEIGVCLGGTAQVKIHDSSLVDNGAALTVMALSCSVGQENEVNTYGTLELVGSVIIGQLWYTHLNFRYRMQHFIDEGNTYLRASPGSLQLGVP